MDGADLSKETKKIYCKEARRIQDQIAALEFDGTCVHPVRPQQLRPRCATIRRHAEAAAALPVGTPSVTDAVKEAVGVGE